MCPKKSSTENKDSRRNSGSTETARRGRFIVLGSSGECLPVNRPAEQDKGTSLYSSCNSSEEEFHSARTSLDEGEYLYLSFFKKLKKLLDQKIKQLLYIINTLFLKVFY